MTTTEHVLEAVEGSADFNGRELPTYEAACSCGAWSRKLHSFDAHDPESGRREELARDFAGHVARLTAAIVWPANGAGLHPLLTDPEMLYPSVGHTTEGEYRENHVPYESGMLRRGTTYTELVEAIRQEMSDALDGADAAEGVPLEQAPNLAAAVALLDQLRKNLPKVRAWRVMVVRTSDKNRSEQDPLIHFGRPWCTGAYHSEAEALAALPRELERLNKDQNQYDPYVAEVSLGPTDLYRLRMPR